MTREDVDDAVDRLRRVLGVQGREHEVTGLGRGQRGLDRLEVTHLTDEDDVRVLTQDVAQGLGEGLRVLPDLTLVDYRALVLVQELDRVLDRHDVHGLLAVDDVDQRRERGALAGSGRAGDEHEATRQVGEAAHGRRHPEAVEGHDLVRDGPHDRADVVALEEHVDPEAAAARERVRAVELQLVLELLPLLLGEDRVDHLPDLRAGQRVDALDRPQLAVHPDDRRAAGGQVEVRAVLLEHLLQQVVDVDALDIVLDRIHIAPPASSAGTAGPKTESIACWISYRPAAAGTTS